MKDYRLFDITDFVLDEDFIRWVYKNGEKDQLFWNNWLRQNPDKHLVVSEARRILESIKMEEFPVAGQQVQDETDRLLLTISRQSESVPLPQRQILRPIRWWYAAAAVLIIAVSLIFTLPTRLKEQGHFTYKALTLNQHLVEHNNTSDKPVTITLHDGSIVELAPNGRISYANNFDTAGTRDVYLSGQAFFKVTKNPRRPFRVFANEIVTKVLGTSFLIRSYENDTTIRVIVRTGKVSVYSQASAGTRKAATPAELGGYILTPNQQLVYEKAGQKFQKILLEQPEMITPGKKEPVVAYEDAPLEDVFNELITDYGINIVYDSELVKKCTVTADLRNETFYRRLDLICRAVGARYQVIDGQVVIQANGCE
jgi:ferric-dicitrate binding protein FerR (iron transport regulator)